MEKCYANALGDCCNRLSKEHYVSKSILEFAVADKGRLIWDGPGGSDRPKGAANLTNAKVLCVKHNNELSQIDAEMFRLVDTVFHFNRRPTDGPADTPNYARDQMAPGSQKTVDFDGELIARWLMKFGAGAAKAKVVPNLGISHLYEKPWLEVLFGRKSLPYWCGFTVTGVNRLFPEFVVDRGGAPPFVVAPTLDYSEIMIGSEVGIYPFELFGLFGPDGAPGQQHSPGFRPSEIRLFDTAHQILLILRFGWQSGPRNIVELRLS